MIFDVTTPSDSIISLLTQGGPTALLALGVFGFVKGWIVTGRELQRVVLERDEALKIVYAQAHLANRTVDIAASRLELEEKYLEMRRRERSDGVEIPAHEG